MESNHDNPHTAAHCNAVDENNTGERLAWATVGLEPTSSACRAITHTQQPVLIRIAEFYLVSREVKQGQSVGKKSASK